jgi:hypothetical protein
MQTSSCTVSYFRNDLQSTKLPSHLCPVKNCSSENLDKVQFQKSQVPFCPEHGIRIHNSGFVYYNGNSEADLITATRRNLFFYPDYYISNFFRKNTKMESGRLCYESSEDAVSYNVFTALLSDEHALKDLVHSITGETVLDDVDLYLWGNKIDLKNNKCTSYPHLKVVRKLLENDIKQFKTEPDIMLVVPKKMVICIEAKFGSKNPIATDKIEKEEEKPKRTDRLIERYCNNNNLLKKCDIFDLSGKPLVFYEQLFRNIVFAASMAQLENAEKWYVVNLRNEHLMNLKRGKPESMPVMRAVRSILKRQYKTRFSHLTWEEIHREVIVGNPKLYNLSWYFKNKSLYCSRAFNVF